MRLSPSLPRKRLKRPVPVPTATARATSKTEQADTKSEAQTDATFFKIWTIPEAYTFAQHRSTEGIAEDRRQAIENAKLTDAERILKHKEEYQPRNRFVE